MVARRRFEIAINRLKELGDSNQEISDLAPYWARREVANLSTYPTELRFKNRWAVG